MNIKELKAKLTKPVFVRKQRMHRTKKPNFFKTLGFGLLCAAGLGTVMGKLMYDSAKKEVYINAYDQTTDSYFKAMEALGNLPENAGDGAVTNLLSIFANYYAFSEYNFLWDSSSGYDIYVFSDYDRGGCGSACYLSDDEGNILYDSRRKMRCSVAVERGALPNSVALPNMEFDTIALTCDPDEIDDPEFKRFMLECWTNLDGEDDYTSNLFGGGGDWTEPYFTMTSGYMDYENSRFIPKHIDVEKRIHTKVNGWETEQTEYAEYDFSIPVPEGWELVDRQGRFTGNSELPCIMTFEMPRTGTDKEIFAEMTSDPEVQASILQYGQDKTEIIRRDKLADGSELDWRVGSVTVRGQKMQLVMLNKVNFDNHATLYMLNVYAAVQFIPLVLIAFILSCLRYSKSKAVYAFENYQRDLTNNLAHDLKTPLTAISGYAENLASGMLTEEESREYLQAIMDNVSHTDSIITRTLELSSLEHKGTKKENIDMRAFAEECADTYALMLKSRGVNMHINGSGTVQAYPSLKTALENLISNAVNYTPDGGNIAIDIDNRAFTVKNTFDKKIDTTELAMPFKKGDKARSKRTSGLGLSLAQKAAEQNGFKLQLSSDKDCFTAQIVM